jgi:hypothetical protein
MTNIFLQKLSKKYNTLKKYTSGGWHTSRDKIGIENAGIGHAEALTDAPTKPEGKAAAA